MNKSDYNMDYSYCLLLLSLLLLLLLLSSSVGIDILLPVNPATRICIPVIKSAIAMIAATNPNPNAGDTNISIERAISNAPTPIVKALSSLLWSLCLIPCTILEIPSNSNATATNIITKTLVASGNVIATIANIITSIPSPKFEKRALFFTNIPAITFSIPTINKRTETRTTRDIIDIIGLIRINIDKIIASAPSPI